jgi:choline dehydrogenase-like flavoprotein
LLLEAGGVNDSLDDLSGAERMSVAFAQNSPLNWNYRTVAQTHLKGQEIDYSRGKGLGGSNAIVRAFSLSFPIFCTTH